jgi:serine/threonine protein kinase
MVGQHIGKYRVTEQIGRGGMGTVYRAMDETLHREVAVKVLNTDLNDPTVARRFRAEAVTVARLNHPGIATIYELLQHDGQWLMVMEFLRGETLEALVARNGALPIDRATDLVMQALAALAHAHSLGVVHRDLKPANLMLSDNGIVKIMDFGIARVAGGEQLTSAGFMMGTPAYMAPEQVLGQEIDARTDLYATGLVFYHLVTGKLPFTGTTPLDQAQARIQDTPTPVRTARPDLPAWTGQVLDVALARAPEARYQTALLFREALRRGLANLPVDTPTTNVVPPELVATAAPSSMPILTTPPQGLPPVRRVDVPVAAPQAPDASSVATVASASLPIASQPAPLVSNDHKAAPDLHDSPSRLPVVAGAAVLLAAVVGLFFWMRSSPSEPAPPSVSTTAAPPSEQAPVAPPVAPAASAASAQDVAGRGVPAAGTTPAAGASATATARGAVPGAAAGTPGAVDPTATAAARGDAAARGAAADATVTFKNVRAFLVVGSKVEERDAILAIGGGRVAVSDERGERRFGSMNYADITAVAHTRAKNPRWYPTLAAPPANVDMPGGLFRSDRHWIAFQSRSTFLIVRVDDNDFRRVLDTANARLKVKAETLQGR